LFFITPHKKNIFDVARGYVNHTGVFIFVYDRSGNYFWRNFSMKKDNFNITYLPWDDSSIIEYGPLFKKCHSYDSQNMLSQYMMFLALSASADEQSPQTLEVQVAQKTELPKNDESDQQITSEKPQPIYKEVAFYRGYLNLLYSSTGGMKSLLSIDVGNEFKKCLYILVDKDNRSELSRYVNRLGSKANIITLKNIQHKTDAIQSSKKVYADFQIMHFIKNKEKFKEYCAVEDITGRIYKGMGIAGLQDKVIKELEVLDAIIADAIDNFHIDFICLDSLNGLFGDTNRLNRMAIRKLTQRAVENEITMLCIHHDNGKGEIAGRKSIAEEFDYIYRILPDNAVTDLPDNEKVILLVEEKASYSNPKTFRFKAIFEDALNPKFVFLEQCDNSKSSMKELNLTESIKKLLNGQNGEVITFVKLKSMITRNPPPTDTSIKNCLKTLADQGIVQKTDNSWSIIKIL
jgi:hypothetical protein